MRIFKNSPVIATQIAGEIINLLTSVQYFDNGMLLDKPIKDYPCIVDGSTTYSIDLEKARVYFPYGYTHSNHSDSIRTEIVRLYKLLPAEESTKTYWNMKCDNSLLTVVRCKTNRSSLASILKSYQLTNFQLNIGYTNNDSKYMTFIRDFGIFVDTGDLTVYGHNELTYEVSPEMFIGYKNIIESFHKSPIDLRNFTNPIMMELRTKKEKRIRYKNIHKNITKISYENNKPASQTCNDCGNILYGENYIFRGNIATSNTHEQIVVCPVCAHCITHHEMNYFSIYSITYPTSIHDIIDVMHTDTRADVLHALVEQRKYYTLDGIKFIVAGKDSGRYIVTDNGLQFIVSEAFRWYSDYKIISMS